MDRNFSLKSENLSLIQIPSLIPDRLLQFQRREIPICIFSRFMATLWNVTSEKGGKNKTDTVAFPESTAIHQNYHQDPITFDF